MDASNGSTASMRGRLLKVLGVGFGLAVSIGATVGVGILRSPGPVAGLLEVPWLIILAWSLGGVYCLLGANYLTELATMIPKAGGFYVYAERAFGRYGGFVVGWSDWLNVALGTAFVSVVFGEYASGLFTPHLAGGRIIFSLSVLVVIAILNLIGVRAGSTAQQITSFLKGAALIAFVVACFALGTESSAEAAPASTATGDGVSPFAAITAFVLAFQIILSAYEGWYAPIYFSEEDSDPQRNLPRSIFGGIALITAIYVLVNVALLHLLPTAALAGSKFAGADAMSLVFGASSGKILTVLALLSFVATINALMMSTTRTLFGLGREGLFIKKAAEVNSGGTPVYALLITAGFAIVFSIIGSFELLLAISQFFALVIVILLIISLFMLRRKEPDTPRPYRALAYPFAPAIMWIFAVLLFFGYIFSNPYPSLYALAALSMSYPIYRLIRK